MCVLINVASEILCVTASFSYLNKALLLKERFIVTSHCDIVTIMNRSDDPNTGSNPGGGRIGKKLNYNILFSILLFSFSLLWSQIAFLNFRCFPKMFWKSFANSPMIWSTVCSMLSNRCQTISLMSRWNVSGLLVNIEARSR